MKLRLLRHRSFRKLLRNRLALLAMAIVSLYLLIAVATSALGIITIDDTFRRVGPKNVPGLFREQTPEKRAEDVAYIIGRIETALSRGDAAGALQDIRFGHLRLRPLSLEELQARIDAIWAIYDRLADREDLNVEPSVLQDIQRMERMTYDLFQPLEGWRRVARSAELLLGTDAQGRSIFLRAIYSI